MAKDISAPLIAVLPRLRRFALSLAGRRDVADDLVQISCEKALPKPIAGRTAPILTRGCFDPQELLIDHARRRKTEGKTEDVYEREDLAGLKGEVDIENRLMLQKVWELIGTLPDEQREVLLLVCVEGLATMRQLKCWKCPPARS